jgi:mRNA-degrading endonuclease toxin of MazEF toxin-antitoxin module
VVTGAPVAVLRVEVWLANLDPTIGGEIQKTRP